MHHQAVKKSVLFIRLALNPFFNSSLNMHMQCRSIYSFAAILLACLGMIAGSAQAQRSFASNTDVLPVLSFAPAEPLPALTFADLAAGPTEERKLPLPTRVTKRSAKFEVLALPVPLLPCPPCPTDAPPVDCTWSSFSTGWVDIGDGCIVNICYCTRMTSPGNYDFVITQIQISDLSEGCGENGGELINNAYEWMRQNNPMGFPCPPCHPPGITNYWREVRGQCWGFFSHPTGGEKYWQMCSGGNAWCMTPFRVCCDPDETKHFIQGATVVFGTASCVSPCNQVTCTP